MHLLELYSKASCLRMNPESKLVDAAPADSVLVFNKANCLFSLKKQLSGLFLLYLITPSVPNKQQMKNKNESLLNLKDTNSASLQRI